MEGRSLFDDPMQPPEPPGSATMKRGSGNSGGGEEESKSIEDTGEYTNPGSVSDNVHVEGNDIPTEDTGTSGGGGGGDGSPPLQDILDAQEDWSELV